MQTNHTNKCYTIWSAVNETCKFEFKKTNKQTKNTDKEDLEYPEFYEIAKNKNQPNN